MKAHRYKGYVIRHAGGNTYRIFRKGDYVAYGTSLHGAKHWVDSYGTKTKNPRVKLPANWTPAKVRVLPSGDVQIGLSQNPMSAKGGRFVECVKAVEHKGGARDARAVCGAMEKRRNPRLRFHQDGTVTVWDVYTQTWIRLRPNEMSDRLLASLRPRERERVLKHGTEKKDKGEYILYLRPSGSGIQIPTLNEARTQLGYALAIHPGAYLTTSSGRKLKQQRRNGKRKVLKRVRKALTKYVRGNPGGVKHFRVQVPATRSDIGYDMIVAAKTASAARAEAKRYCAELFAERTGRPKSQFKMPAKTRVTETTS